MYIEFNFYNRVCVCDYKEVSRSSYTSPPVLSINVKLFIFRLYIIKFFFLPFSLGRRTGREEKNRFLRGVRSASENAISES